jgi:hypothetical protein
MSGYFTPFPGQKEEGLWIEIWYKSCDSQERREWHMSVSSLIFIHMIGIAAVFALGYFLGSKEKGRH